MTHNEPNFESPDLSQLRQVGVRVRDSEPLIDDPLQRFRSVPNHAMFVYTSEDRLLDTYIRSHWDALSGMSGDFCDIYISLLQLSGEEDFYSQMDGIRTIAGVSAIRRIDLPAIHLWSGSHYCTISFRDAITEEKLRDSLRTIFDKIADIKGPIGPNDIEALKSSPDKTENIVYGQGVFNSRIGGNLIQIVHSSAADAREKAMSNNDTDRSKGQTVNDAYAKKSISQSTDTDEFQSIQRVVTTGGISQNKTSKSGLTVFGIGKGTGYGVLALVVIVAIYALYKVFKT